MLSGKNKYCYLVIRGAVLFEWTDQEYVFLFKENTWLQFDLSCVSDEAHDCLKETENRRACLNYCTFSVFCWLKTNIHSE